METHTTQSSIPLLKAFSYGILVPIFTYTGIPQELFMLAMGMIAFDIITGAISSWTTKSFKSRELTKGIVAKLMLMLVPFILVLAIRGVVPEMDTTVMVKMVLSTYILSEAYSSLGNIVQIYKGDKKVSEQDAITMVITKAQDIIKSFLDSIMTKK
jgi:toxin secretion/phage lysis holin